MTTLLIILFCSIVLPIWLVLHYLTQWRSAKSLNSNEGELLEALWKSAHRMEERIDVLETILDKQSNQWRGSL